MAVRVYPASCNTIQVMMLKIRFFFESDSRFSTFCLLTGSIHFFLLFLRCLLKPLIIAIEWCRESHTLLLHRVDILPLSLKIRKPIRAYKREQRALLHLYKGVCSQAHSMQM